MGVSKNRGGPPKWMVKLMENPIKIRDLGVPLFSETPIYIYKCIHVRYIEIEKGRGGFTWILLECVVKVQNVCRNSIQ